MKLQAIRAGAFLRGPSGQIRKVTTIHEDYCVFEVVDRGVITPDHTSTLPLGATRKVKRSSLAAWAHRLEGEGGDAS